MEARRGAIALALACAAQLAAAHDSWFAPGAAGALELATGTRYPVQDLGPPAASLVVARCRGEAGEESALAPEEGSPKLLVLRAPAPVLACWAELKRYEIELPPQLIRVYLDEVHASPQLRATWQRMQARGLPWREGYRKFARIELARADATAAQRAAARRPAGLDLELVVLGDAPIDAGRPLEFQLLRDGRPLAGQPVELVSERSRIGIWRDTDAEGKLRHVLPFGGRWLLRAVDLRLAPGDPDRWESRFVTLAIEAR